MNMSRDHSVPSSTEHNRRNKVCNEVVQFHKRSKSFQHKIFFMFFRINENPFMEKKTQKTVLITPKVLRIILALTLVYALLFYSFFQWSLETVAMYVTYVTCVVCFVFFAQFSERAQKQLVIMAKDVKTIQSHWEKDQDLRYLTYVIRGLYGLAIALWIAGFYFLANLPMEETARVMSGFMPEVEKWLWGSKFSIAWMMGSTVFVVSATIELVANLHIIFYRNTPVRGIFTAACKVCYEWTGKVIVGTSAGISTGLQLGSFIPGMETTIPMQILQKFGPFNAGYSYELGTRIPSLRNGFLLHVPGYNPWDFVDPQTLLLDSDLQDKWIKENIGQVRTHCSASTLQLMQIDPKPFSRY